MQRPEQHKKAGVSYAFTDDGIELPVIDLAHPTFALPPESELAAAFATYARQVRSRSRWPAFTRTLLVRLLARKSALLRAVGPGQGGFMSGVATYLMKLGADNLGSAYATPIDRKLAAAYPPTGLRLRMRATRDLLVEALARQLAARPGAPVNLLNIGGGPAMDSLNAILQLHRQGALAGRTVRVHVFDREPPGPRFGARALAALTAAGGPLAGLEASLEHIPYDWNDAHRLPVLLPGLGLAGTIVAASSEGALFDYGSDDAIVANLAALRGATPTITGSVTRDDETTRLTVRETTFAVRPLGLPAFTALAARAGWQPERVIDMSTAQVVRLTSS